MISTDDRPVVMCTWPDGRVVARCGGSGDGWIWFRSYPSATAPRDMVFAFEVLEGRSFVETLPGFNSGMDVGEGYDPEVTVREAGKLLWFAGTAGIISCQTPLPIDLFHRVENVVEGGAVVPAGPLVPLFVPDEKLRIVEVADGLPVQPDLGDLDRVLRRTLPDQEDFTRGIFSFNRYNPQVTSFWFRMKLKEVKIDSTDEFSFKVVFDADGWKAARTRVGDPGGQGPTLGAAILDYLRQRGIRFESERSTWESKLEPGTVTWHPELFELLGEPAPALWDWPAVREWAEASSVQRMPG